MRPELNPLNIPSYYQGRPHQKDALLYLWDKTPTDIRLEFTRRWRTMDVDPRIPALLAVVPADRRKAAETAIPFLIEACVEFGVTDRHHVAYIMATVSHECLFKPIKEFRAHPQRNAQIFALQQRYWGSGYYGRGYVQLTWRENYIKMGRRLGISLMEQPDLALVPKHAARICVCGMAEGIFTGRKLADYNLTGGRYNFFEARRIVNILDKAALIAGYAEVYLKGLESA